MSQAAEVARTAAVLGRPVVAVLLTHPHPDHVGGLPALLTAFPGVLVAASARTAEVMRTDEGGVLALARSFLGDDFAAALPEPSLVLPESGALEVAGLRVAHAEVGPGETACATVFVAEGTGLAFVGDVAANGFTPWLAEGRSAAWLDQIARAGALLPPGAGAHPGHGPAAPAAALLAAQRDYTAASGRSWPGPRRPGASRRRRARPWSRRRSGATPGGRWSRACRTCRASTPTPSPASSASPPADHPTVP